MDLKHKDGIDETSSEPPGLDSHAFVSIDDGVIKFGNDGGTEVFLVDDEPPGLGSAVSAPSDDGSVIDLDDTPSEPAELGSLLSASIVIETWSKPPRPGSIPSKPRLSASIVIDPCNGAGIFEIPSEPPGLGSSVSASNDNGGVINLDDIPSKPPGLGSRLSSSSIVIASNADVASMRL